MNTFRGAARLFSPRLAKCILGSGLSVGVLFASGLQNLGAQQSAPPPVQSQDQVQQDTPPVQSQDQVQRSTETTACTSDSRSATKVGSAHCTLSGFAGSPDFGGLHVS